ncbi:hypothetical protein, partial [uncultured Mobiluncus sp.]|uniref:hypothetical protein n=1 Tax=uncultured Mobiluncus sp. TaxID=293425 RepID=UPI0025FCE95A
MRQRPQTTLRGLVWPGFCREGGARMPAKSGGVRGAARSGGVRGDASQSQKYLESYAFRTASWTLAMQASLLAYQDERARVRNLAEIASTHMLLRGP